MHSLHEVHKINGLLIEVVSARLPPPTHTHTFHVSKYGTDFDQIWYWISALKYV